MFKKISLALSAMVLAIGMFSITPTTAQAKVYLSFGSSYGGWGSSYGGWGRPYSGWRYNSYFTPSYAYYPWGSYNYSPRRYGLGFGYTWLKGKGAKGKKSRYIPTRSKRRISASKAKRICFANKRCRSAFKRYNRKHSKRRHHVR